MTHVTDPSLLKVSLSICLKCSNKDSSLMNYQEILAFVPVRERVCACVPPCVCVFGQGINEDENRRHCLLCLCMRVGRCV